MVQDVVWEWIAVMTVVESNAAGAWYWLGGACGSLLYCDGSGCMAARHVSRERTC